MAGSLEDALARALAGDSRIWTDPGRLRAVLMGLSPGNQAYRQALVAAAEEGIVQALLDASGTADLRNLSAQLQARTGMDRTFADWAIQLWSSALGLAPDPEASPSRHPEGEPREWEGSGRWKAPILPDPSGRQGSHQDDDGGAASSGKVEIPAEKHRTSWPAVGALCVLSLALAGLLFQKTIFPRPKTDQSPALSQQAAAPEDLERLKTTFVGTRSLDGKPPEVFSLQIQALHPEEGRITFEYTLNNSGSRRDNLGAALPREGRIEIPDLGVGKFFLEHGQLVIVIQGASPENHWELRETP